MRKNNECSWRNASSGNLRPMDSRLLDASWNGNVVRLYELLTEDRGILHNAAFNDGQNPLHVSCLGGHFQFVQVLIVLMPDFARELNSDGFSPLHIASAKGFLDIVILLLRNDQNLCLVQGVDEKIPLHCAVIKGRIEVVRALFIANNDSIGCVTARGETVLHLAVKNNQFRVFQYLVENLVRLNQERVLNYLDDQGNTVLHLAVSKKLYQVIKLLLDERVIRRETFDLSSRNNKGLTPLDVLTLSQREAGDTKLEDLLRQAGAQETLNFPPPANQIQQNPQNDQPTSWIRRAINYFMYPKLEDCPSEQINFLLVIAILIVAATYQAALSPPGGVWQDDRKGILASPGQASHDAGKAVMATKNPIGFKIYVFFNTLGFYVSISLICVLTSKFPMRVELLIAMFALCFTYGGSLSSIVPDTLPDHTFFHLCVFSVVGILPLTMVHWYRLNTKRDV